MLISTALLLAFLILLVAVLYSSVGHGGASGYLAVMALVGVGVEVMKPTSLMLNIVVASIAVTQFSRAGFFSWRLFWPFAVTSVPAAFAGGAVALRGEYYKPLIGLVLLWSAWRMFSGGRRKAGGGGNGVTPPRLGVGLSVGAGLGLLSGLSGTGGGIFLSPIVLMCGWANTKVTAAVSAAFILVNSVSGLVGFLSKGNGLPEVTREWFWVWSVAAVAGGVVGSSMGAWRLPMVALRRLLGVVLVVAGLKLVAGAWGWASAASAPAAAKPAAAAR